MPENAFESGFRWVDRVTSEDRKGAGLDLMAPSGLVAATVFYHRNPNSHAWFIWDEDGVGGENSIEPTIEAAKIAAESAVLRWGKHFATK